MRDLRFSTNLPRKAGVRTDVQKSIDPKAKFNAIHGRFFFKSNCQGYARKIESGVVRFFFPRNECLEMHRRGCQKRKNVSRIVVSGFNLATKWENRERTRLFVELRFEVRSASRDATGSTNQLGIVDISVCVIKNQVKSLDYTFPAKLARFIGDFFRDGSNARV